jgi:AmmeMemoRadiSam system protein B
MDVRKMVFAGSWYPESAPACETAIAEFTTPAPGTSDDGGPFIGGIVPHAGWVYSGRIACQVIKRLKEPDPIDVVVLFGMHLHEQSANYMMDQGAWATPFGHIPVEEELALHLKRHFPFQLETPRRFVQDNTIELQMPLIHHLLSPATVLGLGVAPRDSAPGIGEAVADWAVEQGKRLKVVGSTDLTHYGGNYGFSPHGSGEAALAWVREKNDRRLIDALLEMAPLRVIGEGLENQNACCAGAAAAAVAAARRMGATRAQLLEYATSHDITPGDSFVGYAGVAFG